MAIVVANQDAVIDVGGVQHVLQYGVTLADDRHEVVTRSPGLWKPLDVVFGVDDPEPKAAAKPAAARKAAG
jgi:hypothetical protein